MRPRNRGNGDLETTPHTTAADFALDPSLLGGVPQLDEALRPAGLTAMTPLSVPVGRPRVTASKNY